MSSDHDLHDGHQQHYSQEATTQTNFKSEALPSLPISKALTVLVDGGNLDSQSSPRTGESKIRTSGEAEFLANKNYNHGNSGHNDVIKDNGPGIIQYVLQPYRDMGLLSKKKKNESNRHKEHRSGNTSPASLLLHRHHRAEDPLDIAVAQVISALDSRSLHYEPERARTLLRGRFCSGSPRKAINLALALRDAEDLILIEPTDMYMHGAENLRGTTCYLDALLFSMFSRCFPLFDALLYHQGTNAKANKLMVNLRLFVNLLRSGHLVTTDVMDMVRTSIADCGWEDARSDQQQDTSECFGFIAEMLEMPMLTFKVHIAHGGKTDASEDNKIVQERFLALAIPPPPPLPVGTFYPPVELVDLIDDNFYSKLEVRRPVARSRSTMVDVSLAITSAIQPEMDEEGSSSKLPSYRPRPLMHGYSLDKKDEKKEVSMQAWQLFELVPHYTPTDDTPRQIDVGKQPPVVVICLKRYYFDQRGTAIINPVPVIIPEYIDFDQYTGSDGSASRKSSRIRLRLESAVCHRGQHVASGHYVSISRGNVPDQWLLFDDLAQHRVTQAPFKYLFQTEVPYLLFYQLENVPVRRAVQRRQPSVPNFGNETFTTLQDIPHVPLRPPPAISGNKPVFQ